MTYNKNFTSTIAMSLGMLVAPPTLADLTVEVEVPSIRSVACGWLDTGVVVPSGITLGISATGTWSLGNEDSQTGDANGLTAFDNYGSFLYGTLVGRIGDSGTFLVGNNYSAITTSAGLLFLANNDSNCSDNSGSLQVTITLADIRAMDAQDTVVSEDDFDVTAKDGCCCLDFEEAPLPSDWKPLPDPFRDGIFYSCYQKLYPTYQECKATYGTFKHVPHAGRQEVTSVLWFIERDCRSVILGW
jgi:hypothetical protein